MAGVVGALVMSVIMFWLRAVGVPLHIEQQLAVALGTRIWLVGFLAHLLIGGAIALVYGIVFEVIFHRSGVGAGVVLGAMNTIFAGFAWAVIGGPGRFWGGLGPEGVAALFLVHMAYGAVVGGLYKAQHLLVYD